MKKLFRQHLRRALRAFRGGEVKPFDIMCEAGKKYSNKYLLKKDRSWWVRQSLQIGRTKNA